MNHSTHRTEPAKLREITRTLCERMANALDRISLKELQAKTFSDCFNEHLRAIIIEASLEFQLSTEFYSGGHLKIVKPPDLESVSSRILEYAIILNILELSSVLAIERWKDIEKRLDAYGMSCVIAKNFVLSDSMKSSFQDEVQAHNKSCIQMLRGDSGQQLVFKRVMDYEQKQSR